MQKARSVLPNKSEKNLDHLSATVPTSILGIFSKVANRLFSWLERKVDALCTHGDSLTRIWHQLSEQLPQHAIQTQNQCSVVSLPSLALFFHVELYNPSVFSQNTLLAAFINAKLFTEQ